VLIAPQSPWQNPFAERLIGSIRRECLDHVIVLSEAHLRRILRGYLAYYHDSRTHRALDRNAPNPRLIETPDRGQLRAIPQVGGRTTATLGPRECSSHSPSEHPDLPLSLPLRACRIRSQGQSFHFLPEASTAHSRLALPGMAFSAPTDGSLRDRVSGRRRRQHRLGDSQ
jgi:hypothetical protein